MRIAREWAATFLESAAALFTACTWAHNSTVLSLVKSVVSYTLNNSFLGIERGNLILSANEPFAIRRADKAIISYRVNSPHGSLFARWRGERSVQVGRGA